MIWMFPALNNLYPEDKYLFCSSLGQYGTNILLLCKISHYIKNLDILCCKIIEFGVNSQIWLNQGIKDCHLGYIRKLR
jgi:hypothetical protein